MTTLAPTEDSVESHLHPRPSWDVADHPVPTGREEIWRYTPLDRLAPLLDPPAEERSLTWTTELPAQVRLETVTPERARALAVAAPVDRVSALAAARASRPVHLDIPAGAELDRAIVLDGTGTGGDAVGRLAITVGAGATATIVLRHRGNARYAAKYDLQVGDGAAVNLICLQDWDDAAVHGGETSILVGRDARVRTVEITLGGSLVRLSSTARFSAPGGSLEQFGLYFADAGQHLEHRLFVDHDQPHTCSNVDYRGALQGEGAHSVWVGDVLIRKQAHGISSYEQNRNLVLTRGCIADSVPNLEIETGEIAGAGHSSTTGRFDDEQLFYLMSRGIPADEAKRLVVEGFFVDIIRRVGVPDLEAGLLSAIRTELAATLRDPSTEIREASAAPASSGLAGSLHPIQES